MSRRCCGRRQNRLTIPSLTCPWLSITLGQKQSGKSAKIGKKTGVTFWRIYCFLIGTDKRGKLIEQYRKQQRESPLPVYKYLFYFLELQKKQCFRLGVMYSKIKKEVASVFVHTPFPLWLKQDLFHWGLERARFVFLEHLPVGEHTRISMLYQVTTHTGFQVENICCFTLLPCSLIASFPALGSLWFLIHYTVCSGQQVH